MSHAVCMITMHSASAPTFIKMLKNARVWLDKAVVHAEQKKYDVNAVLLQSRLAPDMFPLVRQLQSASDNAKGSMARLAGVDIPKFEDTEKTVAELQARLDKTVAFVETITVAQLEGSETREIVLHSGRGDRKFVGVDYLHYYALPNFFFHVTSAYAIMRHNGVDIGKVDYLNASGG